MALRVAVQPDSGITARWGLLLSTKLEAWEERITSPLAERAAKRSLRRLRVVRGESVSLGMVEKALELATHLAQT